MRAMNGAFFIRSVKDRDLLNKDLGSRGLVVCVITHQVVGLGSRDSGSAGSAGVGLGGLLGGQQGALLSMRCGRGGLQQPHTFTCMQGCDFTPSDRSTLGITPP